MATIKDTVSAKRIQLLHPAVREIFTNFIAEAEALTGTTLRVVQGLRTIEEQNALYAQGRTKPGNKVTNAKGGSSYHNYGLAIDIAELKNGKINWDFDYKQLLPLAKKYNLTWGGLFTSIMDKPHYELTFGHNWRQLLVRNDQKRFIPGTKYVDIA